MRDDSPELSKLDQDLQFEEDALDAFDASLAACEKEAAAESDSMTTAGIMVGVALGLMLPGTVAALLNIGLFVLHHFVLKPRFKRKKAEADLVVKASLRMMMPRSEAVMEWNRQQGRPWGAPH